MLTKDGVGVGAGVGSVVGGEGYVDLTQATVAGEASTAEMLYAGEYLVVGLADTLAALLNGSVMILLPSDPNGNDDGAAVLTLNGQLIDKTYSGYGIKLQRAPVENRECTIARWLWKSGSRMSGKYNGNWVAVSMPL